MMPTEKIAQLRAEYFAAVAADKAAWGHRAGPARTATEHRLDLWRAASEARDRYVLARLDTLELDFVTVKP